MLLQRKAILQILLLLLGMALLCYGILRGEVDTIYGKAVKLCLECVGIG